MNNITFAFPHFPLLTQPELITEDMYCDENNLPPHCAGLLICPCIFRIKVRLNSIVEMVLFDDMESKQKIYS